MSTIKILLVCMGNICRSPTAEGVLRHLVSIAKLEQAIEIDSAGTADYHVGEPPDWRSQAAAKKRGIDISGLRARVVEAKDFAYYDYILAMDQENYQNLQKFCPQAHVHKLGLFMDYAPQLRQREVPDPYYGGDKGFDNVLDLIDAAAQGLLKKIAN